MQVKENGMNSDVREKISGAATVIELTLGVIILIACVVASLGIVFKIGRAHV